MNIMARVYVTLGSHIKSTCYNVHQTNTLLHEYKQTPILALLNKYL